MSPAADLSALGIARLVADFLIALQLDRVTLVGSDTGGAICQLVATRHHERVARLVLTDCDAYDDFPPFPFNWTPFVARVPDVMTALMQPTRLAWVRRLAIRLLTKYPVPDEFLERWARPGLDDGGIRRDGPKLVRSLSPKLTREAAYMLRDFHRPVLLIWAPEDHWFKLSNAQRLAEAIQSARLELVDDSRAFVQEDQLARFAELVRSLMHTPTPAPPTSDLGAAK
jgi:pimeloyl-ACP methyl ester carboxylesterase